MKLSKTTILATLLFSVLSFYISPVFSDLEKSQTQKYKESASSGCNIPAAFTDLEVMATTMADPAKFAELMALVNNPQTTQAMMQCSMEPKQWNVWMTGISNPAKMMNAFTQFINPQIYTNWMTASMNPQTYKFMYAYMNPAFYMQWMTASMDPQFYQPMYRLMDSTWQQESSTWMMDPKTYQKMFEAMFAAPIVADATNTK